MNRMNWRSTLVLLVAAAAIAGASRASGATSALAVNIDSGPSGTVTSTDATFAFSAQGGAGAVTFECTLDRAASACTSPKSYSRLAVGTHVFGVVATDARRGRASARRSWIIAPPAEPPPPPPGGPPAPPAPPPSEPSSPAPNTGSAKRVKPKALCPRKRSLGPPIVHGCSALQVVTGTELAGPFVEALGKATEGLGAIARVGKGIPQVERGLREGKHQIQLALHGVALGDVCGGSRAAAAGVKTLQGSAGAFGDIVAELRRGLQEQVVAGGGDADERDVLWHELGYRDQLVENAVDAGKSVGDVLRKTCGAVVWKGTIHGQIGSTDDATHTLRLADGKLVGVAGVRLRHDLVEGTASTLDVVRFHDGTILAVGVDAAKGLVKAAGEALKPQASAIACLSLRIAPSLQSFTDPANVTLHYPGAYKVNGVLRLEAAMRLGAKAGSCPEASQAGDDYFNRYSMKIEMTYEDAVTNKTVTTVVAPDLEAGETAVLPSTIDPGTNATIAAEVRKQTCTEVANGWYADQYGNVKKLEKLECGVPQVLSTESYSAKVRPKDDFYFQLEYENVTTASGTPAFDLEDDDLAGFRVATLGGITPSGATAIILPGTNAYAYARGFLVTGNSSSKPLVETLATGDAFAVYNVDAWNPSSAMVKGTRNGKPFWYAAGLPELVRDVVDFCPGYHSYYRMPWLPGMQRKVSQGNDTTFTHKGKQKYAFDFNLWEGLAIRAARGGTVTYLEESLWKNSDPNKVESGDQKWQPANALRIEHQDGTASWYYHMKQNGVLVDVGDKVHRGDEVALAGNTGNSTGAHLHYQVQDDPAEWAQSIQIKFQSVGKSCYIPQKDDWPMSNNT